MNLKTTKKITEEQILTFYNLNYLFSKNPDLNNDELLKEFKDKLQWNLLRTMTCVDVMFRISPENGALRKTSSYEKFEKQLNLSSHGCTSPLEYFKVWELFETRYVYLFEVYDYALGLLSKEATRRGFNPSNPNHIDHIATLFGFDDFESLMTQICAE